MFQKLQITCSAGEIQITMAQANPEETVEETSQNVDSRTASSDSVTFKFNAHAPEFVPRSQTRMPASGYFYPYFQFLDGSVVGSDWIYLSSDQDPSTLFHASNVSLPNCSKNVLNDDLHQRIIKQVENLFSDLSLLSNDAMMKHVAKDPEGYVPIQIIASMKKIKALVNNNHDLVVQALGSSSELVLSNDCKSVKRSVPFTEIYKEDLQCRTVIAGNLPEDQSYQNLEKIFSRVGSVIAIRLCQSQEANVSRTKTDVSLSNKDHVLVEYDNASVAEKAAEQLNDEMNWRKGLRVRVLMQCSNIQPAARRKSSFDMLAEDEEESSSTAVELVVDTNALQGEENCSRSKKRWPRGHGKGKGRRQGLSERGLLSRVAEASSASILSDVLGKQVMNKGPRMPDGTRGFTMGRGKPFK